MFGDNVETPLLTEEMHALRDILGLRVSGGPACGHAVARPGCALARNIGGSGPCGFRGVVGWRGEGRVVTGVGDLEGEWWDVASARGRVDV